MDVLPRPDSDGDNAFGLGHLLERIPHPGSAFETPVMDLSPGWLV